jgi:hypothetical protein
MGGTFYGLIADCRSRIADGSRSLPQSERKESLLGIGAIVTHKKMDFIIAPKVTALIVQCSVTRRDHLVCLEMLCNQVINLSGNFVPVYSLMTRACPRSTLFTKPGSSRKGRPSPHMSISPFRTAWAISWASLQPPVVPITALD